MKVMALDYGSARTGVAVSDPTGTIARPLTSIERVMTNAGLERLAELVRQEEAELVVVGMPFTLRGELGAQAEETGRFVSTLRDAVGVPVDIFDERFTTALAARDGGVGDDDSRAAAHLLSSYLAWTNDSRA